MCDCVHVCVAVGVRARAGVIAWLCLCVSVCSFVCLCLRVCVLVV